MTSHAENKKPIVVAAAVIMRDGKILIAQRGSQSKYAGWWEFPGGKTEPGEDLRECVRREIREELGVVISAGEELTSATHDYSDVGVGLVHLHFFLCDIVSGEPSLDRTIHSAIAWVSPREIRSYRHLAADKPVVDELCLRFG